MLTILRPCTEIVIIKVHVLHPMQYNFTFNIQLYSVPVKVIP